MEFEWDSAKAESNLTKHGVEFVDAAEVFGGPRHIFRVAPRSHGETRYEAIGSVMRRVIFVVYTMRDGLCRIIGAMRASRREREAYSLPARD
jgi:uncharacterized protein